MPLGINFYDEERLQGRNVANANAVNIVSPGIVEDGLVLYLDAGNRVSYPTSGTVWYDLSGYSLDSTLTNGPTFDFASGGSIVFNGTSNYVQGASSEILQLGSGNYTISYWVYFSSLASIPVIIDLRSTQSGIAFSDYVETNKYKIFWNNTTIYNGGTLSLTTATWYNIVVTRFGSSNTVYINNAIDGTFANSTNLAQNSLRLGRNINTTGPSFLNGQIALCLIYKNRALTPVEVDQNFNATRARFGV